VIADRYARPVPLPARNLPVDGFKCITAERDEYVAATVNEAEPVSTGENREELQSETISIGQARAPGTHGRGRPDLQREVAWIPSRDRKRSPLRVAVAAVEPSPRSARSVVPPRHEFGRLFAKLRRGL